MKRIVPQTPGQPKASFNPDITIAPFQPGEKYLLVPASFVMRLERQIREDGTYASVLNHPTVIDLREVPHFTEVETPERILELARSEETSNEVASIAGRMLSDLQEAKVNAHVLVEGRKVAVVRELRQVVASALTQTATRPVELSPSE